jgi:hypothetical protein
LVEQGRDVPSRGPPMSLDKFASSDGKLPQKPAVSGPPEESDEDLFNFDELTSASAKAAPPPPAAASQAELEAALGQVQAAKQEVARAIPPPVAAQPTPSIRPVATVAGDEDAATRTNVVLVPQRVSFTPLVAALVGGVALLNITLIAFAWHSVNATRQVVLDVASDVREASSDLRSESERRTEFAARAGEPVFGALPEGFRTLDIARQMITRGEHVRARRLLHGLLAVVDRVQQPARAELEARAAFLIADSFRIEADALTAPGETR